MSRWRPPSEKSSPYITPEGYQALEAEYQSLWQKRTEVTAAVAAAAAEGDRSENAEYIYRKKQLREIDRRVTYLQKRMPQLNVVRQIRDDGRVYFGCRVTLENLTTGDIIEYRIIGADEIDSAKNHISVDAPLARLLLGKSVNDGACLTIQNQTTEFIIVQISII